MDVGRYEIVGLVKVPSQSMGMLSLFRPQREAEEEWKQNGKEDKQIGFLKLMPVGSNNPQDVVTLPVDPGDLPSFSVGDKVTVNIERPTYA